MPRVPTSITIPRCRAARRSSSNCVADRVSSGRLSQICTTATPSCVALSNRSMAVIGRAGRCPGIPTAQGYVYEPMPSRIKRVSLTFTRSTPQRVRYVPIRRRRTPRLKSLDCPVPRSQPVFLPCNAANRFAWHGTILAWTTSYCGSAQPYRGGGQRFANVSAAVVVRIQ